MIKPGCNFVPDFKMLEVNTRRLHSDTKTLTNTQLLRRIECAQLIQKLKKLNFLLLK